MWKWLLSLILLPLSLFGKSEFSAQISLTTNKLSIEENLGVTLTLAYPNTYTVNLEKLRINLLKYASLSEPPFALINEKTEISPNGKQKITFTLEPQLAGLHFISLYDISFLPKDPNLKPVEIITDIYKITVTLPPLHQDYQGMATPLLSLTQQFPITINPQNRKNLLGNPALDKREAERNTTTLQERSLPWMKLVGVLLFVVVLFIARMQPPRKKNPEKQRRKLALSAQQKALKTLKTLKQENTPHVEYYSKLTDAIRKYIEERFQVKATRQTTEEFLDEMSVHELFNAETQSRLSDFLSAADKVKFADATPSEEECHQARALAIMFISG